MRAIVSATSAQAWLAAGTGDLDAAGELARAGGGQAMESRYFLLGCVTLYQAVRLGAAARVVDLLGAGAGHVREGLVPIMAEHAEALVEGGAARVDSVARRFCGMGARLAAAEAYAQAASLDQDHGEVVAARRSATLSRLLQRRCPGAATPALVAKPGSITDREIDVAVLAAAGLSSRDTAGRLYLSPRTVDNQPA